MTEADAGGDPRSPASTAGGGAGSVRGWALAAGLLAALLAYVLAGELPLRGDGSAHAGRAAIAVTVLTASAWLLRSMPLAAASLLPLALLPLSGAQPTAAVARSYAAPIVWLFLGGFVLALGIERWGLHRRIALRVIGFVGLRPRRIVLGFTAAGLLLSMWISNTATALMLLPIGWALVERVGAEGTLTAGQTARMGPALMLGIAYGCSVGGTASPIGTPPNLLFLGQYAEAFEGRGAPGISFLEWMVGLLPFALVMGLVVWLTLVYVLYRLPAGDAAAGRTVRDEVAALPPMSAAERRMLACFGIAVLLWVLREPIDAGAFVIPGWQSVMPYPAGFEVHDGSVAVAVAVLTFLVPSGGRGSPRLMDWETARRLRFDILFLLGGGVAIAGAFEATGVSVALGDVVSPWIERAPPLVAVAATALFVTFLTEVTSNTAVISVLLPVLLATSAGAGLDPRVLMLTATIAASCAFMLPIATPPNAVVFSSGRVTMAQMARAGLLLNFVSVAVLTLALWVWVLPVLGIDVGVVPEWAR